MKPAGPEKNSRLQSLEGLLKKKKKVLIVIHDSPDPDALASAFGFKYLLQHWKIPAVITYRGIIGRAENRAMIKALKIDLVPFAKVNMKDFSLTALVDTQPGAGNNPLPAIYIPDIVIDHHMPFYETSRKARFLDIRTDYGSTSTIITEYLVQTGIEDKNRNVATALLYGIKSDTRDLGRETAASDMNAYLRLYPHVLFKVLSRIEHPKLSRNHFRLFQRAINRALIDRDLIIVDLGKVETADNLAEMADFLIRMDNIRWVLCLGEYEGSLFFSIRTTHRKAHAGIIAQKIARGSGGGGGHCMVAGGKIDAPENYEDKVILVRARFLKEIKRPDFKGEPLAGTNAAAVC